MAGGSLPIEARPMAALDPLTQRTMSTHSDALTQNDRRGFPSFIGSGAAIPALGTPAGQVAFASSALMVAAAEFAICTPILLILVSLRFVPVVDAAVWGLVTLVPLSVSICFLALVGAVGAGHGRSGR